MSGTGVEVKVMQKGEVTTIKSCLKDFTVIDPAPTAIHPKVSCVVLKSLQIFT